MQTASVPGVPSPFLGSGGKRQGANGSPAFAACYGGTGRAAWRRGHTTLAPVGLPVATNIFIAAGRKGRGYANGTA